MPGVNILSWNVFGVAISDIDAFLRDLSDETAWGVLLLQEFSSSSRFASPFYTADDHLVLASPACSGQRRTAIVVNNEYRHGVQIETFNSRGRTSSVDLILCGWKLRLVTSHLFSRHGRAEFAESLADLKHIVATVPKGYRLVIGVDGQDDLGPWQPSDGRVIGEHVYGVRGERGDAVLRLLHQFDLTAWNTFFAGRFGQHTCHHYGKSPPSMMDFVLSDVPCRAVQRCEALDSTATASDHRPVEMHLVAKGKVRPFFAAAAKRVRKPIGWKMEDGEFRECVRRGLGLQAADANDMVDVASVNIFLDGDVRSPRRGRVVSGWGFAVYPRVSRANVLGVLALTEACGSVVIDNSDRFFCGARRKTRNTAAMTSFVECLLYLLGQLQRPAPAVPRGSRVNFHTSANYVIGLILGSFAPRENLGISILVLHLWDLVGKIFKLTLNTKMTPDNLPGFDLARSLSRQALWDDNQHVFWKRDYPRVDWSSDAYIKKCFCHVVATSDSALCNPPSAPRAQALTCQGGVGVRIEEEEVDEDAVCIIDLDPVDRVGPSGEDVPSLRHITQCISAAASRYGKIPNKRIPRLPADDPMILEMSNLQRLRRMETDHVQRHHLSFAVLRLRRQIRRREASMLCTEVAQTRRLPQAYRKRGGLAKVAYLERSDGMRVADAEGKGEVIRDFYEHLLNTAEPDNFNYDDLGWIFKSFSEADMDGFQKITGAMVQAAVATMKKGKTCGEDLIVTEMLEVLDEECFEVLALAFNFRLLNHLSESWDDCWDRHCVTLLRKRAQAHLAKDFRPIAVLPVLQKLYPKVLVIISGVKDVELVALQFAFRAGYQAHEPIWIMRNQIEKAIEWAVHLFAADGDLVKAYDFTQHGEVVLGMREKEVADIFTAAWLREVRRAEVSFKLDVETQTGFISRNRSLEQGDSAAPSVFNITLDRCAGAFFRLAQEKKWGVRLPNQTYLALVLYADNWWLFSTSPMELQVMMKAWLSMIRDSGWDTPGGDITWCTTAPDSLIADLWVDGILLKRTGRKEGFKVLGTIVTFDNRFDVELNSRISAAWKAFYRVQQILRNKDAPLGKRLSLLKMFIYPTLFWAAGSWNLDVRQLAKLRDCHQKMLGKILNLHANPGEGVETYMARRGATIKDFRRRHEIELFDAHYHRLHFGWGGHLARMGNYDRDRISFQTLIFKDWKWIKSVADRNGGRQLHGRCLRTWRWERPLYKFAGNSNWMEAAGDKRTWISQLDGMVTWRDGMR